MPGRDTMTGFSSPGGEKPAADPVRLVFAGKVSREKGVLSLIRSLGLVDTKGKSLQLAVAGGNGDEKELGRIRALAEDCPWPVSFTGRLPQEKLAEVYNESHVFVLPSFYEGLPLTVMEALACGCRVIVTDLPGIRPFMETYVPCAPVSYVRPPRMRDTDQPLGEDLPAFERELAEKIRGVRLRRPGTHPGPYTEFPGRRSAGRIWRPRREAAAERPEHGDIETDKPENTALPEQRRGGRACFIDLHMHEMRNSGDSFLLLEEIVEIAKKKGLDAICITDHDSMDIRDFCAGVFKEDGLSHFVGIEFYSLQGDIIAYGVRDYPRERVSAQEFIDLVREQGGVCYSAHPFRNNRRGMEEHLDEVTGLSGIEVLNGSTHRDACLTAAAYARRLDLIPVGASDCHVPEKVGVCATYFPMEIRSEEDLVRAFKTGGMKPAYYEDGAYHIVDIDAPESEFPDEVWMKKR